MRSAGNMGLAVVDLCTVNVLTSSLNLQAGFDESYTVDVSEAGACSIVANTAYGAIRGLESFTQLVIAREAGLPAILGVPVAIQDEPRYAHRGLLVDSSRHYLRVEDILDVIEGMAQNKLNVLHWHIVDDNSFPYESKLFPSLSEKGAYDPTKAVFTPSDVQRVINEARLRGIRVVVEFDTPGHVSSWLAGEPSLRGSGECDFDPTLESTYTFIEAFLGEARSVFPDQYIHLGGDEVDYLACWNTSATIRGWMTQHNITDPVDLQAYYESRLVQIVNKLGIQGIYWQEVFQNGKPSFSTNSVIEVWKGLDYETLDKVLARGLRVIMSGGWYLDHLDDTWDVYYTRTVTNGTHEGNPLVMGGEACMWGESVDYTNLMSRIWPRASAVAEVLWSPQEFSKVPEDAAARLHKWKCTMNARGIQAEPIGSWWSANDATWCYWETF